MAKEGDYAMHRFGMMAGLIGLGCSLPVHADWAVIGVAMECDARANRFTLAGTVAVNEGNPGAVPFEEGFAPLNDGKHELECRIGNVLISATIRVDPPHTGVCMGAGYAALDRFNVGAISVLPVREAFNWNCTGERKLVKMSARLDGLQVRVERCFIPGDAWPPRNAALECEEESSERFRASFDCTQAATATEQLICGSDTLSHLDHQLFATYREAARLQRSRTTLTRSQREWLAKKRNSCAEELCLRRVYEDRIAELRHLIPKVDPKAPVY